MSCGLSKQWCVLIAIGLIQPQARCEGLWQWSHEAAVSGTAHVFDGGDAVVDSASTILPQQELIEFDAMDIAPDGTQARAHGSSLVFASAAGLFVGTELTSYVLPMGGDLGGIASSSIESVVEFTMPFDAPLWEFSMHYHFDSPDGFGHASNVILENLSTSTSFVIPIVAKSNWQLFNFDSSNGDRIRVTALVSAGGEVGLGQSGFHVTDFRFRTRIPEPSSVMMLAAVMGCLMRRRTCMLHRQILPARRD